MKIISLNVGRPRLVMSHGQTVSTGIFKEPVEGRVMLRTLNLDGDRQADLTVHGGPAKAVYVYPTEHYEYWKRELPSVELPWGMFGENFTVEGEGADEQSINLGDRFRVGGAEVFVTQPRLPCYKLGIKFGRADILKRFLASGRTGFYLGVRVEGEVGTGDELELISRAEHRMTVAEVARLYVGDGRDTEALRRALEVEALPEGWREHFRAMLERKRR
jgi:MOSC domain-containing protein YiiM